MLMETIGRTELSRLIVPHCLVPQALCHHDVLFFVVVVFLPQHVFCLQKICLPVYWDLGTGSVVTLPIFMPQLRCWPTFYLGVM